MSRPKSNALRVVGVGYQLSGHVTREALCFMKTADRLFFLVDDPVTERWLRTLNPHAVPMPQHAKEGRLLSTCCDRMVDDILAALRQGLNLCFATTGHPGVSVYPTHEAVRRAEAEGYPTIPGATRGRLHRGKRRDFRRCANGQCRKKEGVGKDGEGHLP